MNLPHHDDLAADWAARLDAGPLSEAEKALLISWLSADPQNEERLHAVRQLYRRLGEAVPRLADGGRLTARSRKPVFTWPRLAATVACAAALIFAGLWYADRPESLATTVAHRQSVVLADGSQVEMNAQTLVEVRMRRGERHVQLARGEAYFAVTKDATRPFLVETPAGTVRVTGTAFNVRSTGVGQLEVTVAEGSVAVTPAGGSGFNLTPNDQLTFDGAKAVVTALSPDARADALAWREGRAVFDSEPLGSAVQRFARYHGKQIDVSPEIARLELGGRFMLDELNHFLSDVEKVLPVKVLRLPDDRYRVVPRS